MSLDLKSSKDFLLPTPEDIKDEEVKSVFKKLMSSQESDRNKLFEDIKVLWEILAGTKAMQNILDMGSNKINNVTDPAANQDAATKKYVDDNKGGFVNRGDPAAYDYTQATLILDGAYHDLDLSAIVPAGATAILLVGEGSNSGKWILFRKNGNANTINISAFENGAVGLNQYFCLVVPCDVNRVIEYRAAPGWTDLNLTVGGWWF